MKLTDLFTYMPSLRKRRQLMKSTSLTPPILLSYPYGIIRLESEDTPPVVPEYHKEKDPPSFSDNATHSFFSDIPISFDRQTTTKQH